MNVIDTQIPDVKIIEPKVFGDHRVTFESFLSENLKKVCKTTFVQDNESKSKYGFCVDCIFKEPYAQAKLVRVVQGKCWMWR